MPSVTSGGTATRAAVTPFDQLGEDLRRGLAERCRHGDGIMTAGVTARGGLRCDPTVTLL